MKTFLGKQYEAHNALADVRALQELLRITVVAWQVDFFTFEYYVIKSSLEPFIKTKVISTVT